jgi:hypothetical protein
MKRAALGIRMHSGWGVPVAVSGDAKSMEVIGRRRIVTTDPTISGTSKPYHFAASLKIQESEKYLANCAAASERLALAAVGEVIKELDGRHYES